MSEALINAINHVRIENELVTIYVKNGFGSITKVEGKLVELYSRVKYAQYNDAVKFVYIPKRARLKRGNYLSYKPWILVVAGHGHPEPASMYDKPERVEGVPGVMVSRSSYSCFDERFGTDFERDVVSKINPASIIYKRFE